MGATVPAYGKCTTKLKAMVMAKRLLDGAGWAGGGS
jgi:hypothetical protein